MTAVKPEWAKADYPSYEEIAATFGDVVKFETTGAYQGDHEVLVKDEAGRWGIVIFGYGSCSGCDSLEACAPYDPSGDWSGVVQLRDDLAKEVAWFDSPADAVRWIDEQLGEDGPSWWRHDAEIVAVLTAFREQILPTVVLDGGAS